MFLNKIVRDALKECSRGREVIVTITDRIHSRWALNLQHNKILQLRLLLL